MLDGQLPTFYEGPAVETSLQGRAVLENYQRSMRRRLAVLWIGGPALTAIGCALGLSGDLIVRRSRLSIVYAIRTSRLSRRLRELPELPQAEVRRLPGPSEHE